MTRALPNQWMSVAKYISEEHGMVANWLYHRGGEVVVVVVLVVVLVVVVVVVVEVVVVVVEVLV